MLRDRPLLLCIAAASLVQASNGLYSYSTLRWTAQGLSTALISLLWVVGVASEVLFFFAAPKVLARVGAAADPDLGRDDGDPMDRLAITADPTAIAVLQLLQCFTLAGNAAIMCQHIAARAPATAKTSAIALYALLSGGVFMFASIQLGGALYRHYAPGGFLVMALCALGAVPLLRRAQAPAAGWRGLNRRRRRRQRPPFPSAAGRPAPRACPPARIPCRCACNGRAPANRRRG